jgi:hypothetical protein
MNSKQKISVSIGVINLIILGANLYINEPIGMVVGVVGVGFSVFGYFAGGKTNPPESIS